MSYYGRYYGGLGYGSASFGSLGYGFGCGYGSFSRLGRLQVQLCPSCYEGYGFSGFY
uniref:Uncharacterized protein n=1 Tax=Propithecus coquereli TaxID=379532 RepID=A0A2K6FXF2_PROCO